MTTIQLNFNNLSEAEALFSIFPASDKYEFTAKRVFRLKHHVDCSCGDKMVHNGYDYARKKGFGKVRIGKQLCKTCGNQYHEDKSFWKKLLSQWKEMITKFIMTLRDADVSWDIVSKLMNFIIPFGKTKAMYMFNERIEQFEYPQENYLIVNYDEQHPKKGRTQKFRLTLLNYKTKIPIADCLFDNKNEETIRMFLREHLDTEKELIIITDCDRRYPKIFNDLWGNKLIHQKCLLHLNKLVVKDFEKTKSLFNEYNKYLLLNIFYNRGKELKFLEKLLKKQDKGLFADAKEKNKWVKEKLHTFREYVKKIENQRRRGKESLSQRPLWKAKQLLAELWKQKQLFPKKAKDRLKMIQKNWKFFTAFYAVKDCPATNNAIENYFSTSLKTHRKKQLRTDKGLLNHMKLAALKRVQGFANPKRTILQLYGLFKL
ncbi:MAG: ISNCY family transposase, partial [Nanoarchaeota archaeon]